MRYFITHAVIAAMLLGGAAHADDDLAEQVQDLKVQADWNEMLILTANSRSNYDRAKDISVPEWQRTGCTTRIEFHNGEPRSVCVKGGSND